ncbi:MAG: lysoplasmalogenase [Rhodospirillales bacterium]|nr:lysoplasmalogenase [Rhodospirillales bacterium]
MIINDRLNFILLALSTAFAVAHLYGLQYGLFPSKPLIKAPVVIFLCIYAFMNSEGRTRLFLCVALLFSDLGDIFLAMEPSFFLHGLISFLVAHLFYIALFLRHKEDAVEKRHILIGIAFAAYGVCLVAFLYPSLGTMAIPVMVYAIILILMGVTANMGAFGTPMVALGALSFILSDSGIAVNKFHMPMEWLGYITWPLYVVAQFLIVLGATKKYREGARG